MLGDRLRAAAEFVRRGAVFADIGTDHAYLPIFLLSEGIVSYAVCSDVNGGPLENAKATAEEHGVRENIEFRLADGAIGLEDIPLTDVAICGMGGELIASIIDASERLKSSGVRLILQPMSRQEHLLSYLNRGGFEIVDYAFATESEKSYIILAAEYKGKIPTEDILSVEFLPPKAECARAQKEYLLTKLSSLTRAYEGKCSAGAPARDEAVRIEYVRELISSLDKLKESEGETV